MTRNPGVPPVADLNEKPSFRSVGDTTECSSVDLDKSVFLLVTGKEKVAFFRRVFGSVEILTVLARDKARWECD